ncbi:magnesium transporter [Capnocytophaga granulosa]|jgi:magnesium transporter|uniref:magnesium transporter n=1 Tax=Capnocytophaga granulosa TaxID=45242 RepID=UPI0023F00E2B|nr:magnesium transporter [Capnocytophaga granulosa]
MQVFKLTEEIIEHIHELIASDKKQQLKEYLEPLHFADIAEIIKELDLEESSFLVSLLSREKASKTLTEVEEEVLEHILEKLSNEEIASYLQELDTDDATYLISKLPEERQTQILSYIKDKEHAQDIVDLLRYEYDTAGGLMAKELVKVNENWDVDTCMKEIREQGQHVTRVHSIYVVDDDEVLKGRLSLKDLITSPKGAHIRDIYIPKVDYVFVHDTPEEVARVMQKYNLEAIPVVDKMHCLVGRITIDSIMDLIKEEAEHDYQMAAGITEDVEADDTIWKLTRARLPWLLIGMAGGIGAASIINGFQDGLTSFPTLLLFIPLIQSTAGNVGVQSSAIVVQGLANNSIDGALLGRLFKEFLLGLINGLALATLVLMMSHFVFGSSYLESATVCAALVTVIINAAVIGTFIPIFLHSRGIDPAVATGPFITTSNDILGILIYFMIAKIILGF